MDAVRLDRVNLILFDAQLLARDPCEVVGPTTAGRLELVLHERIAANKATRLRLDLDDIKARTLKCCSQRRDLKAEPQSTRHYTGEPTNLERNPPHATAPRVLSHHLDDTLCQRKFVHFNRSLAIAVDVRLNIAPRYNQSLRHRQSCASQPTPVQPVLVPQ
jgi:hypothetical protein